MIRSSLESKLYILQRGAARVPLLPRVSISLPRRRTAALAVLACLLILVLLAYRTRVSGFRWDVLFASASNLDWLWLASAILLILLSYVGRALRWQAMLRPFGHPIGVLRLTSDTLIGATVTLLCGRVGEVVRPYLISLQTGLPVSSQAAAWFLERILDLLMMLLIFGYALTRIPYRLAASGYLLAAAAALCLVLLFALRDPQGRARLISAIPEPYQPRVAGLLTSFGRGLDCTRDARSLTILLLYTVLEWTIIIGGTFAMFRAFSATKTLDLDAILVLLAFVSLGNIVQLPAVGGGAQAACILALTKIFHLPIESATGVALLFWFFGSFCIVPVGLLGPFHEGLNWSKLKSLSAKQILDSPEA